MIQHQAPKTFKTMNKRKVCRRCSIKSWSISKATKIYYSEKKKKIFYEEVF